MWVSEKKNPKFSDFFSLQQWTWLIEIQVRIREQIGKEKWSGALESLKVFEIVTSVSLLLPSFDGQVL